MGGQTDGRTNERTDERKSPCVLQDFVPFGAAAQKPELGTGAEYKSRAEELRTGALDRSRVPELKNTVEYQRSRLKPRTKAKERR